MLFRYLLRHYCLPDHAPAAAERHAVFAMPPAMPPYCRLRRHAPDYFAIIFAAAAIICGAALSPLIDFSLSPARRQIV
jgi:hypothetical protein